MAILIISPEAWDSHSVSKHHYAQEVARRGHRVLYHGPPAPTGPMRLDPVETASGDLSVLRAPRVAPGLRFLPALLRRGCETKWLKKVEQLCGQPIEVVWNFENSRFFDMNFAGERLKIYHQVDLNQDFHPETAAATADHVFCTSKLIQKRLIPHHANAQLIQHGVQIAPISAEREAHLFAMGTLNCLYVGNLSMEYLDRDLLLNCLAKFPDMTFNFVGGFREGDPFEQALRQRPNAVLHGKVAPDRILSIIANADILLVTYAKEHFDDQSNPHKIMEYMMGGKVIVATYTQEYEAVSDLLAMGDRDTDFVQLLGNVAREIEAWNTPELMTRRRAFAADNTYPRQLDRIAQAIGPRGHLIS